MVKSTYDLGFAYGKLQERVTELTNKLREAESRIRMLERRLDSDEVVTRSNMARTIRALDRETINEFIQFQQILRRFAGADRAEEESLGQTEENDTPAT
jgi:ribosomal protein L16 Arg81 hydroxylase